jgi:hypothetical protein
VSLYHKIYIFRKIATKIIFDMDCFTRLTARSIEIFGRSTLNVLFLARRPFSNKLTL